MQSRIPGRIFAPLALIAVALAVVLLVSMTSGSQKSSPAAATTAPKQQTTIKSVASPTGKTKVYVVRKGDLLSTIAEKLGMTVAQIEALNPDLDPQTLIPGQSIKIGP
ncbi:MAG: LysM domain-containing protein [Actinomycetota bacterium]